MVTTRSQTSSLPAKRVREVVPSAGNVHEKEPKATAKKSQKTTLSKTAKSCPKQPAKRASTSAPINSAPPTHAAQNITKVPKHQTARFFNLPPELRNEIYSQVLTTGPPIPTSLSGNNKHPLLGVCQQIRAEVLPMWNSEQVISVPGSSPAMGLLRNMTRERLRNVREVQISTDYPVDSAHALACITRMNRTFDRMGLRENAVRFCVKKTPQSWRWEGVEWRWMSLYDLEGLRRKG